MDSHKATKQMPSASSSSNNQSQLLSLLSADIGSYYGIAIAGAVVASTALYYYASKKKSGTATNDEDKNSTENNKVVRSKSRAPLLDFKNQTRATPDGGRVVTLNKNDNNEFLSNYYEDGKTLYEIFKKAIKISKDGNHLGWKPSPNEPYKWLKYSESFAMSQQLGSALLKFGVKPQTESMIGVYAKNRPEWVITEQACNMYSLVLVPLYDTLGVEAMSFILDQTNLKVMVCDDSPKAIQLLEFKGEHLEFVIVIDEVTQEARDKAAEKDIKLFSFNEMLELGKSNLAEPVPPKPDDLCTICYTSGTTGLPKGAMITHRNIVAIASSMVVYVKRTNTLDEGQERYISYLPLAHMFERICQATLVSLGGGIGFFEGDIKKLVDNIKEVKPTIFCTVPRLLNRIYAKITDNLSRASPLKQKIFKLAYSQKEKEVLKGINRNNSMWDFAFRQIRETLGGCCKFIITGSAPISPEILQFLRVVCGCYVLEGYGATETGGACGVQIPGETTVGNVGPPFLCSAYKLADVPEMGLVASRDNKGEVLVKGSNIFKGYFKDEEKTKAALEDGWYHTGDIGSFAENGTLKIVDRVKHIFKLAQGEYIAPEKIENIYVRCKYVAQVFVHGNSFKSSLVGIIVPEPTTLVEFAKEKNLGEDMKILCKNKDIKKEILDELNKVGKKAGLKGFEQVRDIYLFDEMFTLENGLLTPTMKSKRNELQKYFAKEIDEMYKNLD